MLQLQHPFDLRTIQTSLTEFVGYGGIRMRTVAASFGIVPVETVLDGTARAVEVTATSDGGSANLREWHTGPESGDTVYFERYSGRGRESHGWIDSVSRKVVQTG